MTKKETSASDTPVPVQGSVAPAGYRTQAPAGVAQRVASSSQPALKGNTDYRVKAEPSSNGDSLNDPANMDSVYRWMFIQRQELSRHEIADNIEDMRYRLLLQEDLISRGALSSDDIRAADTRRSEVAGLAALELKDDKNQTIYLVGNNLSEYLSRNPHLTGRMSNIGEVQRGVYQSDFNTQGTNIDLSGPTLMNPRLAEAVRKNPTIAGYVQMTIDAAKRNGIDPIMLANQFYQESRFNPNAVSPAGARGIAQMMPFHQGKFGLDTVADFFDPKQSIEAGAIKMAALTRQYGGDQRLALIAYNGGGKALDFVESKLGKSTVNFNEWVNFMSQRREQLGEGNRSAWHVETLDYVRIITGNSPGANTPSRVASAPRVDVPYRTPEPT